MSSIIGYKRKSETAEETVRRQVLKRRPKLRHSPDILRKVIEARMKRLTR